MQWADVPKWGNYQVSINGLLRNAWTGKVLSPSIDKRNGVFRYRLSNKSISSTMSINKIYKMAFGVKIKTKDLKQQ